MTSYQGQSQSRKGIYRGFIQLHVVILTLSLVSACQLFRKSDSGSSVDSASSRSQSVEAAVHEQVFNETCGTLVLREGKSWLQVVGGNSEDNVDRLLETEVEDVKSRLLAMSASLKSVCIRARFSDPDPVFLNSVSQIKEVPGEG